MRTDIYYWKCDNPLPEAEKLVYNDKYRLADVSELVSQIAKQHFGAAPRCVEPTGSEGNHYTYIIRYPDRSVFFRADDGKIDDDYMDAEAAAMALARRHGIPVPAVYATDTSHSKFPIRYQLLELVPGRGLNEYDRDGVLDRQEVSRQVGRHLARMHEIRLDGFGFFNTDVLHSEGRIVGLHRSHGDYFHQRLDEHLRYLQDTAFLRAGEVHEIETLVARHAYLLQLERGALVHKDVAFWNMVGTPRRVNAIIDWDDVIAGDPVDDLAILRCFYDDDVFEPMLEGYREVTELPEDFLAKLWLFLLRNMLWKAVIRTFMKYFDMDQAGFFLTSRENRGALREFTYDRLYMGINGLRQL